MNEDQSNSTFYVIYPGGDRNKLSVLELFYSESHELDDYAVASRRSFIRYEEAAEYARDLASKHNKRYVDANKSHDYLD